jgi:hypothetical protein
MGRVQGYQVSESYYLSSIKRGRYEGEGKEKEEEVLLDQCFYPILLIIVVIIAIIIAIIL